MTIMTLNRQPFGSKLYKCIKLNLYFHKTEEIRTHEVTAICQIRVVSLPGKISLIN